MMDGKMLSALIVISLISNIALVVTENVVCYHGTWSAYRNGNGKFTVADIDPLLCTHLIYSFVGVNKDCTIKVDTDLDVTSGNFKKFNALKKKNLKLKTMVSVGGWSERSITFSTIAASRSLRAKFIHNALSLIRTYGFDGFDVDWEYPAQRGGSAADKKNFISLLKEFREVWDQHGLILSAAVAAPSSSVDISYDVPAMSKYLDFINIMTYDYHGSWDGRTGQNAPLYASSVDKTSYAKQLNIDASIRRYLARGADPAKINLGLSTYGRTFTLLSSSHTYLGAPTIGTGKAGPYTKSPGMLGYMEICETQHSGKWTTVWDHKQKVPYAYKGDQWIGYDNPKSFAAKVNYTISSHLGGVMVWSIETDDFRGLCGSKYPLLNTIKDVISNRHNRKY